MLQLLYNLNVCFIYLNNIFTQIILYEMLIFHRGGTTLTISGDGLDVIGDPELEVTMVHTYIENDETRQVITVHRGVSSSF